MDDYDSDSGACTGVAPVTNRNLNKGRAGYDMRHRFVTSVIYELPVGKGRHFLNRGGILNYIIGGFDISWIQTVDSGNPLGFTFANSRYNYYPTYIGARVPNLVATPTMEQFGVGSHIGPTASTSPESMRWSILPVDSPQHTPTVNSRPAISRLSLRRRRSRRAIPGGIS